MLKGKFWLSGVYIKDLESLATIYSHNTFANNDSMYLQNEKIACICVVVS